MTTTPNPPTPNPPTPPPPTPATPTPPTATTTAPPPATLTAADSWRLAATEARELLQTAGRLLRRHWYVLIGIAALGGIAQTWVLELAIVVSRLNPTAGVLVFALSPGLAFATAAALLAVMGRLRDGDRTGGTVALSMFASALLLYLVLYEQSGDLTNDRRNYFNDLMMESIYDIDASGVASTTLGYIPDGFSTPVLASILVALGLRSLGARTLERQEERHTGEVAPSRPRALGTGALRLLVTYAELVWLVLSFLVINALSGAVSDWWNSRLAVVSVSDAWASLDWPTIAPLLGAVGTAVGLLLSLAVAGILVPTAWLALGSLIYGDRRGASAQMASRAAFATAEFGSRLRLPVPNDRLVDVDQLQRSWASILKPTSRWGPLGGAVGLVLARGWLPVVVFAILFTLVAQADYVVWWIADLVLPTVAAQDWRAVFPVVAALADVAVQVLTLTLVAAGTDLTLRRLGLPSVLRLPQPKQPTAPRAPRAPQTSNAQ